MNGRQGGFTLLEMLIVLAIAGVLMGVGLNAIRQVQRGGQENAFVTNLSLSIKGAASYAASRRTQVTMIRAGDVVRFVNASSEQIEDGQGIRIPSTVNTNIPDGAALTFGPNGSVTARAVPQPLMIASQDREWAMQISTIGDTRVVETAAVPAN